MPRNQHVDDRKVANPAVLHAEARGTVWHEAKVDERVGEHPQHLGMRAHVEGRVAIIRWARR